MQLISSRRVVTLAGAALATATLPLAVAVTSASAADPTSVTKDLTYNCDFTIPNDPTPTDPNLSAPKSDLPPDGQTWIIAASGQSPEIAIPQTTSLTLSAPAHFDIDSTLYTRDPNTQAEGTRPVSIACDIDTAATPSLQVATLAVAAARDPTDPTPDPTDDPTTQPTDPTTGEPTDGTEDGVSDGSGRINRSTIAPRPPRTAPSPTRAPPTASPPSAHSLWRCCSLGPASRAVERSSAATAADPLTRPPGAQRTLPGPVPRMDRARHSFARCPAAATARPLICDRFESDEDHRHERSFSPIVRTYRHV